MFTEYYQLMPSSLIITSSSGSSSGISPIIQTYSTAATYSIDFPADANWVWLMFVGSGGSGGSGRQGLTATNRCGGGAGKGGDLFIELFHIPTLKTEGATGISLTIGASVAGGASQTLASNNGNNGSTGNPSWARLLIAGVTNRYLGYAAGGIRGSLGAAATSSSGGATSNLGQFNGGQGGNGTNANGLDGANAPGAGGGGGGGGLNTANAFGTGGNGGIGSFDKYGFFVSRIGAAGIASGAAGGAALAALYDFCGAGGGGGAGNGGNGGAGDRGGGGGGGGASLDGTPSGAGGPSGTGYGKVVFF